MELCPRAPAVAREEDDNGDGSVRRWKLREAQLRFGKFDGAVRKLRVE